MRQLSSLGLFIFLVVGVAYSSQGQSLSAREIVDRMVSAYASCHSYVDEGEVSTVFVKKNGRRTVIKPFSTAFVRPSAFRFEFKDRFGEREWNNYIIWKDATSVKTWWSIRPGVESPKDLSFALGAAAGVSSLSSTTVPTLLMPELRMGNRIKALSDLKLVGQEEVNGSNAYRIEGNDSRKRAVTLWIDAVSLLLVKTYQTAKLETVETETTTTYKPMVNVVVQDKLAFNPPEKGK